MLARKQKSPDYWRWALLSMGFLYLAFDEGLSLHERLGPLLRKLLGRGEESESSTTYWWIRGLVAAAVLMLLFWGFLRRLPARTRFQFLLGGALYLVGAVVLDILGIKWADAHTEHNPTYVLLATVEESLEMAGVIVLIYGVLAYLAETVRRGPIPARQARGEGAVEVRRVLTHQGIAREELDSLML